MEKLSNVFIRQDFIKESGIYFLLDNEDNVLYIGSSMQLKDRLITQYRNKDFHRYSFLYLPDITKDELLEIECDMIAAYTPPWNGNMPKSKFWKWAHPETKNRELLIRNFETCNLNGKIYYNRFLPKQLTAK